MIIKDVNDYVERIIKNHPELTEKQVKYILRFGMIAFDNYLRKGYSIKLSSPKVTMWVGENHTNDMKTRIKRRRKYVEKKARLNYYMNNLSFDGYYYFFLTEQLFNELKPLEKKILKLDKIMVYKSFEECFNIGTNTYLFKFYYPTDLGFQCLLENESIRDFKFLGKKTRGKLINKKYVKRNKK